MTIVRGDCVEVMAAMPAASVDAICTDPPYGLEFMGKGWDRLSGQPGYVERGRITTRPDAQVPYGRGGGVNSYQAGRPMQVWHEAWAREALRVLKPGGHLLAFGGTRTYHRLACAVEDAGFEIRDMIAWMYGSGFPKSLDVARAVRGDHAERWFRAPYGTALADVLWLALDDAVPVVEAAAANVEGHGTALKPAHEPIVVARKPLSGTVAANVLEHGTGSMNIDGCRIRGPKTSASDRGESLGGEARPRGCPVHGLRGVRHADASAKSASTTGEAADQLQPRVQGEGDDGGGQPSVDGRSMDRSTERVSPPANGLPQRDGSGAVTDADAARDNGAPSCDVATHGSPAADARACASHQWREGGQSTGEPDDDGLVAALAGAPYGAAATSDSRRGESRPARCTCGNGGVNEASAGRWPANVCLDERAAALLDEMTGTLTSGANPTRRGSDKFRLAYGDFEGQRECDPARGSDSGGASRFLYVAKASSAERNAGLDGFEEQAGPSSAYYGMKGVNLTRKDGGCNEVRPVRNVHPTVKPIALMRWLVRLVTPPGGTLLDPFTGSGSTGVAATLEGFEFVGIEREAEYVAIAEARIGWWARHPDGMTLVARLEAEADRSAVAASGQISIFDEDSLA